MINIGYAITVFVAVVTAVGMLAYLPGVRKRRGRPWHRIARPAVYLSALGLTAATAYLFHLFITHQFQYDYVFRYSSTDMPFKYVVSAFWGGQEGTFLLWAFFGGLLAIFLRFKARHYEAPVLFFYLGINLFLMLMVLKASPFARLAEVPPEGRGMNPLLQDPWMVIHPPIMFFGFASLGIPAAFAMAAMVKEDWDEWVSRSIPWTTFGVIALGTGLVLGGYWAYSILGWGGFWGWDPVENSSLVPWLVAIALLHTQVIQIRRSTFRRLNLLLALMPFVLVTYSTFLTRSGVLADFSVHSFTDLGINQFLVAFMLVFLGGGFLLFVYKSRRVPRDKNPTWLMSREFFLFLGAFVLGVFGLLVLLLTSVPLLTRLGGQPSSVQPDVYNLMGLPFAVVIGLLLGFSPFLIWNSGEIRSPLRRMSPALVLALVFAAALYLAGVRNLGHLLLAASSIFAVIANLQLMLLTLRGNWKRAGGYLSHAGIGLCVVGILASTAYGTKDTVVLPRGEEVRTLGYGFRYMGPRPVEEGRKEAYDVALRTAEGIHVMSPTMFYSDFNRGMMKKPAIQPFFVRDVYLSPIETSVDPLHERIQTWFTLGEESPASLLGMDFRLETFETRPYRAEGHQHTDPGHATGTDLVAVVRVTVGDDRVEVTPLLRTFSDGHETGRPAPIPGTGYELSLMAVGPAGTPARFAVSPLPLELGREETGETRGFEVTLLDFEVIQGNQPGSSATAFAHTEVKTAGKTVHVRPGVISRPGTEELERIEAPIGETGLNLVLVDLDSRAARAFFQIAPVPQEYLIAEASLKPYIILLWIGTVVTLLGLIIGTVRQAGPAERLAARVMGEDGPGPGH